MSNILGIIAKVPKCIWGIIGVSGVTYSSLCRYKDGYVSQGELFGLSFGSAITYAACTSIPMITPFIVVATVYEDCHCRKNKKD